MKKPDNLELSGLILCFKSVFKAESDYPEPKFRFPLLYL